MPCGKRPLVKKWDKPRNVRVITPSRYEQNEASVKQHWKKVIRDLEDSYKDDQVSNTDCFLQKYWYLHKLGNRPQRDTNIFLVHSVGIEPTSLNI